MPFDCMPDPRPDGDRPFISRQPRKQDKPCRVCAVSIVLMLIGLACLFVRSAFHIAVALMTS